MIERIRFGSSSEIEFEPPDVLMRIDCAAKSGQSLDDPSAAASVAMMDPLDFPAVSSAVIDGDKIVIAVGQGIPRPDLVVSGIVGALVNDVSAEIQILCEETRTARSIRRTVSDVQCLAHDPTDTDQLAYLAATKSGKPIYLNRAVVDADFLIPVGCLRPQESFGYVGTVGNVLEAFTDTRTLSEHRRIYLGTNERRRGRVRSEAQEVAWSMGNRFAVQVLAGRAGTILQVLAGEVDRVSRDGQALAERTWRCSVPQRTAIVVAAIEGPSEQQTWANVAQALTSAQRITEPDGSILICSQVPEPADPILRRIEANSIQSTEETEVPLDDDGWTASRLAMARRDARVYLYNDAGQSQVECDGIVHIESDAEVRRLILRHTSCTILGNAQYAVPTVRQEEAAGV